MVYLFSKEYTGPFGDALLFSLSKHIDQVKGQSCFSHDEQVKLGEIYNIVYAMMNERNRREEKIFGS